MAIELELKLALSPEDAAAFRRHALLSGLRPLRRRMLNTYFDTPDLRLSQARMALRLRRAGGKWLQTLKAGGGAAAGLHQRSEWEYPLSQGALELALFAGSALDAFKADDLPAQLQAVFSTDFMRTAWLLEPVPGTRIEIALDQGRIASGRRERAICEVELELKEGDAAALYELAAALQRQVRLRPDSVSKAEQGYRLYRNAPLQPAKFALPSIGAALGPERALRVVVDACLAQAEANAAGVLRQPRDTEFLHQTRVALRRMRSALKLAGQAEPAAAALADTLRPIANALGEARDWDVLIGETLPPLLAAWSGAGGAALLARARRRRSVARANARATLTGADWCAALLALSRWLGTPPAPVGGAPTLTDFAAAQIRRRHKRLLRDGGELASRTAGQRHRARIAAKKLRYGAETFAALFEAASVAPYLRGLEVLQEALGQVNDAQSALRLIGDLSPAADFVLFAAGWFAGRDARELLVAQQAITRLAARKPFWKHPRAANKKPRRPAGNPRR